MAGIFTFVIFFSNVNGEWNVLRISGESQAEVQLTSNMNADSKMLVSYTEALGAWFKLFVEDAIEQQVVNTDMKLRHIVNKAVEVTMKINLKIRSF